ncbi:hemicentin-1-like [Anneissia japonica]|uniref:hemicentin-1-like n=1 Tax=Anneissia japonica TaxID=1529436 RepID=UPI001425A7F3|nr:hemicentin-1-like [Anneissia japonica]
MHTALTIIAILNSTLSTQRFLVLQLKMMFFKILFVGLMAGVEFSSSSRVGKWLPLNSKRSVLRDLMHPRRKHAMNYRGIGQIANTEIVIGSTSGTIGQDEQECLRDHHVTIWNAESQAGTYYKRICLLNRSVPSASSPTGADYDPTVKTSEVDPQFKIITEGYSVTLMCNVNTSSSFEWSRTKPIDKFKYIESTSRNNQFEIWENEYHNISELTINAITSDESGTYVCKATRLDGQIIRFQYELQTIVAPTIKAIKINNVSIGETSKVEYKELTSLTMSCEADGSPTPSIGWQKITEKNSELTYLNSSVIVFQNLTSQDNGTYICNASNSAGVANRTVGLSVLYKPVITTSAQQDIRSGMEEEVPIFCRHHGNPTPNETIWYKDDSVLSASQWLLITDFSLLVKIKSKDDYGDYKCEVGNSQGKTSMVYAISGRPRKPIILSGITSQKRTEYHLRWKSNDRFVVITHFIVRVVKIPSEENDDMSGPLEVQSIRYAVTSTKRHFSLHIQALRPLTTYTIYVKPFVDDIDGDEASITIQTSLEDYNPEVVKVTCTGSSAQPKVLPRVQDPRNGGVDLVLTSPTLILSTFLMCFLIGCK